jgi:hypothetical protein
MKKNRRERMKKKPTTECYRIVVELGEFKVDCGSSYIDMKVEAHGYPSPEGLRVSTRLEGELCSSGSVAFYDSTTFDDLARDLLSDASALLEMLEDPDCDEFYDRAHLEVELAELKGLVAKVPETERDYRKQMQAIDWGSLIPGKEKAEFVVH